VILIVGSNPSRLNIDPNKPFVGSKSEHNLNKWLRRLEIASYEAINVSDIVCNGRPLRVSEWNLERLRAHCKKASKIIALGRSAEKAVKRVTDKPIFYLPHPSPANYALNNNEYIDYMIESCYSYIWEE
jgi:uracil-DNA glycosylase